jgi:hypothetical protein
MPSAKESIATMVNTGVIAEIAPERIHYLHSPQPTPVFTKSGCVTELELCRRSRFSVGQTILLVPQDAHLDVEPHLLFHLAVQTITPEEA